MLKKVKAILKRATMIVACLTVTSIMFSGCGNDNPDELPVIGFSYHDNDVEFGTLVGDQDGNLTDANWQQWESTSGKFTLTAFDVTSGQDPDNNLQVGNVYHLALYQWGPENNALSFRVGRKASKDVANSFNAACPPEHNTFNHTAGELNFWVKGNLEMTLGNGNTYTFLNVYLAQGHSGATNNWWFGSDAMTNSQSTILIYDPYSKTQYYVPIPIYFGDRCFGYISPVEDPTLVFKFLRGDGAMPNPANVIHLIGVYKREQPTDPW